MEVKMKKNDFRANLISIALPITLQSLLQSSFSMVDQIMIGQLGSERIAGIGPVNPAMTVILMVWRESGI